MTTTNPNRDKQQSADRNESRRKQSGDQHVLPQGDPAETPHRPHRISREDMQKMPPKGSDPDDPALR